MPSGTILAISTPRPSTSHMISVDSLAWMLPLSVTVIIKSSRRTVNVPLVLVISADEEVRIHPDRTNAVTTIISSKAIIQIRLPFLLFMLPLCRSFLLAARLFCCSVTIYTRKIKYLCFFELFILHLLLEYKKHDKFSTLYTFLTHIMLKKSFDQQKNIRVLISIYFVILAGGAARKPMGKILI